MTIQNKYYYYFKDINNVQNKVEIWQDTTATLTPAEVTGGVNCFSVELPAVNSKFQPVRGTGADCNIICKNNMEFFNGLYHVNPQEIIIKHFINDSINWIGYMNSELMRETYSELNNYEVKFNANDGFALMDRFYFVDAEKVNYSGIKSQFELLQIIFSIIGLPFNELKICLTTAFNGQTLTDTILHQTFIDCGNYYNEDGEPETLRTVLESILSPYGAFILQNKGNVVITDINNLASNTSFTFKKYSMTTWTSTGTETVNNNVVELSSIGYAGTGAEIEVSGGKNKQVVSYSPYPIKSIIDKSLSNENEFTTIDAEFLTKNNYLYKKLDGNKYWTTEITDTNIFEESKWQTQDDAQAYLRLTHYNNGTIRTITKSKVNPFFVLQKFGTAFDGGTRAKFVSGVAFFFTGEALVKTKNNPYDANAGRACKNMYIKCRLKVGNLYYTGNGNFSTTQSDYSIRLMASDFTDIGNKWIPLTGSFKTPTSGVLFPVGADLSGGFEFQILNYFQRDTANPAYYSEEEVWLKNIGVEILLSNGEKIEDSDIEYVGKLDDKFKDENEKVNLICGTNAYESDRGKLLYFDSTYKPIKEWTRANQTYKIEQLLLNSLSSNYRAGFYTLNNVILNNTFSPITVLKNTNYLGNRVFMVGGYTINYEDNSIDSTLIQISEDALIINT